MLLHLKMESPRTFLLSARVTIHSCTIILPFKGVPFMLLRMLGGPANTDIEGLATLATQHRLWRRTASWDI